MKLTHKGDYALKSVLELAIDYGNLVTIQDLARRSDIPIKFLEQILLDLKRGGFIDSRRGKEGGYFLLKSPAQITVGDVVRYIDGPLESIACVEESYSGCQDMRRCVFRKIWKQVSTETKRIVDGVTFEDLVNKVKMNERNYTYTI